MRIKLGIECEPEEIGTMFRDVLEVISDEARAYWERNTVPTDPELDPELDPEPQAPEPIAERPAPQECGAKPNPPAGHEVVFGQQPPLPGVQLYLGDENGHARTFVQKGRLDWVRGQGSRETGFLPSQTDRSDQLRANPDRRLSRANLLVCLGR